jgi:hypothetical protein
MEEDQLLQEMDSSMRSVEDMSVNEYTNTLVDRINNLTDDEKFSLLDMFGSEEFQLIGKILGPEVANTVGKQINFFAEEAVLNPEGVQPVEEFQGRMQREDVNEEGPQDETERMLRAPSPNMRREFEIQRQLEEQPDMPV